MPGGECPLPGLVLSLVDLNGDGFFARTAFGTWRPRRCAQHDPATVREVPELVELIFRAISDPTFGEHLHDGV